MGISENIRNKKTPIKAFFYCLLKHQSFVIPCHFFLSSRAPTREPDFLKRVLDPVFQRDDRRDNRTTEGDNVMTEEIGCQLLFSAESNRRLFGFRFNRFWWWFEELFYSNLGECPARKGGDEPSPERSRLRRSGGWRSSASH